PSPFTTETAAPSSKASSGYRVAWMPPNTTLAPRSRINRPSAYPRSALLVCIPIPTMSPGPTEDGSKGANVSSQMTGSPNDSGVAPAKTNSQRGVMTAVPKDVSLGLTRCTFKYRPLLASRTAGIRYLHSRKKEGDTTRVANFSLSRLSERSIQEIKQKGNWGNDRVD